MKLRNKKTGEVVYVDFRIPLSNNHEELGSYSVTSLEALNRSFEDYKPTEPLIKDEKIRKAVRAWAEACFIETVEYDEYWVSFRRDDKTISFKDEDRCSGFYELENSRDYTIDELWGEEAREYERLTSVSYDTLLNLYHKLRGQE